MKIGEVTKMGMTSALLLMVSSAIGTFILSSSANAFTFPNWLFTNAELVPLLPALLIVGGFIILTLSYVSWRKYKGEKQNKQERKERNGTN